MKIRHAVLCLFLWSMTAISAGAQTPGIEAIKSRGKIVIGVKDNLPLLGFRDAKGQLDGFEITLARDIAKALGVKLELFPVTATSRLQFLELRRVDLLIASIAITEERKLKTNLIDPPYYASALALMSHNGQGPKKLTELNGKLVCIVRNSHFEAKLSSRAPQAELITSRDIHQAVASLQSKRCDAVFDEHHRLLPFTKKQAEKQAANTNYRVSPVDLPPLPWAMAVNPDKNGNDLGAFLQRLIADWHKSGELLDLEEKWLGQTTPWMNGMRKVHR